MAGAPQQFHPLPSRHCSSCLSISPFHSRIRTILLSKFDVTLSSSGLMGPRWKGKGFEAKARDDPMSAIVTRLQSSMKDSNAHGLLSGSSVILALSSECGNLLNSASFGRPMATVDKEKQWFQLGVEEAFYLHHILNCLEISNGDEQLVTDQDLWQYMTKRTSIFPESFKAYSHLRTKNWVVRSGWRGFCCLSSPSISGPF
ncbi:hypothetical protein SAY86_026041 [Trapa natans]|uniref:tRNA intron endonuclease N-terminal domain-containing protein n=1 Tax=Trapa natans TaxID=22666 RepID=A0AAN7KDK0_TRANT|nr:hypothetical protein SAY86_026041 [Trapa natans]